MKKVIILCAALGMIATSCCCGGGSLKTEEDSLAYALGMDFGSYIKGVDSTMNVAVLSAGIKDALKGKEKIARDSAMVFLRDYFYVRRPAKAKAASEKYLQEVEANNKNIQKTESGILYEIIEPGSDLKATPADRVRVDYKGMLKDGKVFDSSYDRGEPAEFGLNQVIPGWAEGVQLVGQGGKVKLWIPSDLAYGPQGMQGAIGPNEALNFEIEVIEVIPAEAEEKK